LHVLTPAGKQVLEVIRDYQSELGGAPVGMIKRDLGSTGNRVDMMLNRLVNKGYVRRISRGMYVLTPLGEEVLENCEHPPCYFH